MVKSRQIYDIGVRPNMVENGGIGSFFGDEDVLRIIGDTTNFI